LVLIDTGTGGAAPKKSVTSLHLRKERAWISRRCGTGEGRGGLEAGDSKMKNKREQREREREREKERKRDKGGHI
jgi:hypothetical protein